MKTIEIFDPAMCCPTGLCGPNINPNLMRIAAAVQFLQKQGVNITRHNLRDEAALYVSHAVVNEYLQERGADGLPVVLVDGAIAVAGEYPTNEQLTEWTGITLNFVPINQ